MAVPKELVVYENKFGTRVEKRVPTHHRVNSRVAHKELARAREILKIDRSRLNHAKSQLKKAVREHPLRERG